MTGDSQARAKGIADQAAGTAQDLQDLSRQAADTARGTTVSFDEWLRRTIETQPYTAAVVAAGIGWLLGRLHRPI